MREIVPYKLNTESKKAIIQHAIQGLTMRQSQQKLLEMGVDVSEVTIYTWRRKNAKKIAQALENELNDATATSPLATLSNRLAILERVIEEGFDDLEQAKRELASDDELNPEQEAMIRMKGIRSLQAVNDAVKIADAAVVRMKQVQQKMQEWNSKNNMGERGMVEETILTVQKRVYQADEKRQARNADIEDLMGEVEWIEDSDLDD